jgi:hypothetical protein
VLTAGCAGGRRVECHLPITRAAVTGTAVKADIAGLAGGHSGTEIHKGRANAIALLGRYLTLLSDHGAEYAVLTLSGGAKENVIPKESSVTLVLPAGITEAVRAAGQVGSSLQAEVEIRAAGGRYDLLASLDDDLRFVLICSKTTLVKAADEAAEAIVVTPSTHAKCDRCWHYRADVGHDAAHPELCGRCTSNLHGAGEARSAA